MALLGIFSINIWTFGLTQSTALHVFQGPHGVNYWLLMGVYVLFAGKMRAMFSMLFGAGIFLFLTKKPQPGQLNPVELFSRRQLWLVVFGGVNAYVFLWQ